MGQLQREYALISTNDERRTSHCPFRIMFCSPLCKHIFLGKIKVRFNSDAVGGGALYHRGFGRTEVDSIVLSSSLEKEALGNDARDSQSSKEIVQEGGCDLN